MKRLFSFPNPVNDAAARTVALGVVAMSVLALTLTRWALVPLAYGFVARVATGPSLSPLGQVATRVIAPRLGRWHREVAGPPKRFAQGIGATLTLTCAATWGLAGWSVARWILVPLVLAASLEGLAGYCVGCALFGGLIRLGVVPARVCEDCADLRRRFAAAGGELPPS